MTPKLHIDGETFSATPIKYGLANYFADPAYELLMLAWAVNDGPVHLWVPAEGEKLPEDLALWLAHPQVEIHAHNAVFEWHILQNLGIPLPIDRFHCTQVQAYALAFTGSLGDIQDQIGFPRDLRKRRYGKDLINRFCVPAPRNHTADRYDHRTHPNEWVLFKDYCMQDVVAERELGVWLNQYPAEPEVERRYWHLDHKINQRGLQVDMPLVEAALQLDRDHKHALRAWLKTETGLENPGSNPQFLAWIQERVTGVENVQKETLLKVAKAAPQYQEIIEAKLQVSKTSNAKWKAFQMATSADGRIRNTYQFGGAQRTKRWAGRLVQPHNLPSSAYDDPEMYNQAVEAILW